MNRLLRLKCFREEPNERLAAVEGEGHPVLDQDCSVGSIEGGFQRGKEYIIEGSPLVCIRESAVLGFLETDDFGGFVGDNGRGHFVGVGWMISLAGKIVGVGVGVANLRGSSYLNTGTSYSCDDLLV